MEWSNSGTSPMENMVEEQPFYLCRPRHFLRRLSPRARNRSRKKKPSENSGFLLSLGEVDTERCSSEDKASRSGRVVYFPQSCYHCCSGGLFVISVLIMRTGAETANGGLLSKGPRCRSISEWCGNAFSAAQ